MESLRQNFVRSPWKFTRAAACEFGIPQKTAWDILRKKLNFKPYDLQSKQQITDDDKFQWLRGSVHTSRTQDCGFDPGWTQRNFWSSSHAYIYDYGACKSSIEYQFGSVTFRKIKSR
ncbi:hypothetical protein TNCV_2201951 [Trichonephila clavipes]|uniref:Uncharacterized protein n=1 Tax=Trichonephila clavipes TaxID=2585209 RepID=A0A8X6UVI0_TRICX|nr:hypothetical protein TNCV_2201951 [Trichonephila clavipes]